MTNLKARVLSAVALLAIFFSITHFFHEKGLMIAVGLMILLGLYEFSKLHLTADYNRVPRFTFLALSPINIFVAARFPEYGLSILIFSIMVYFIVVLLHAGKEQDLAHSWRFITSASMGMIYAALFPSFVFPLLKLPKGMYWFYFLLASVFLNDSAAYFVGSKFGKRKLFELVSPKKSIEGAWGGLAGSIFSGIIFSILIPEIPAQWLILLALLSGVLGQIGDLFESLMKRVASVKDSSHLIPGHGGVLDRLDGIYFSAPIFYLIASLLSVMYLAKN